VSKYTDDLRKALNIFNTHDIAAKYGAVIVSFERFHPHAFGHHDYRAETYRVTDGKAYKKVFRRGGGRTQCAEAAQKWASERFGIAEWVPTGFRDSWMPKDAKDRMMADLKAWRTEQRRAAKEGTQ
jgi:hypothetical protein